MASRIVGRLKGRQVEKVRPPSGKRSALLSDGGGLYLQCSVAQEGHVRRSWTFRYQVAHARHEVGLGPLSTIGLAKARQRARALREQLLDGLDPLAEKLKARQKLLAETAAAVTFEEVAIMYYRLHADGWGTEHRDQWISSLRRYVFPALGKLAPAAISSAAVLKIIEPLWQTKTVTASRVLNRIEAVLDYCATSGLRTGDNPARGIRTALPKQSRIAKVKHFAALPYTEVGELMQKLVEHNTLAAAALRFLILTASRTDEVRLAVWPEMDLPERVWTVPAERMKSRREHRVPLSDTAIKILRALPRSEVDHRIFPLGMHALLRALRNCADVDVHGLRASFRTWASERTNFPDKIVEAALAHRIGDNKTQEAYERGDLLDRRRRLMQKWTEFIAAPAAAAAVTPLRKVDVNA
jgi:integrase